MIFFISHSVEALIPAIIIVDTPIIRIKWLNRENDDKKG